MSEGSSNITIKLNYIIIFPIYSFTDKLYCLINNATALLELLTALLGYLNRLGGMYPLCPRPCASHGKL